MNHRVETSIPGVWIPALLEAPSGLERGREREKQKPLLPAYLLAGVLFPDQGPIRSWAKGGSSSWYDRRSDPRGLSTLPLILFPCKKIGVNGPHPPTVPPSPHLPGQAKEGSFSGEHQTFLKCQQCQSPGLAFRCPPSPLSPT